VARQRVSPRRIPVSERCKMTSNTRGLSSSSPCREPLFLSQAIRRRAPLSPPGPPAGRPLPSFFHRRPAGPPPSPSPCSPYVVRCSPWWPASVSLGGHRRSSPNGRPEATGGARASHQTASRQTTSMCSTPDGAAAAG
jgi:hypothetical protein